MVVPFRQLRGTLPNLTVVDSGVMTNAKLAGESFGSETGRGLAQAGRLAGYRLNYFLPGTFPKNGVFEVGTNVSLFRDAASRQAFIGRRLSDLRSAVGQTASGLKLDSIGTFPVNGLPNAIGLQFVASSGGRRLYGAFVDFAFGRLLGEAGMGRADSQDVRGVLIANARALRKRMSGVLSGRIRS